MAPDVMDFEDFEILSHEAGDALRPSMSKPAAVIPRKLHKGAVQVTLQNDDKDHKRLPGLASVWVKTFCCSHNVRDADIITGLLQDYGYR